MTKYTYSQLPRWVKKSKRRMDFVVAQSTNDAIVMASQRAPGRRRGGSVQQGKVPVDTGFLANSLVSSLRGGTALTQSGGNYGLVVGSMKGGDVATFIWTAAYARPLHYGYVTSRGNKVQGWHWVDAMIPKWPGIVRKNVMRAKALFR